MTGPRTSPDRLRRQRLAPPLAGGGARPGGRKREGEPHPRTTSGGFGLAAFSCPGPRPEPPAPPGPRSSSRSGQPSFLPVRPRPALPRLPAAPLAGFSRGSAARGVRRRPIPWPRSDRVTGACHMIVAHPVGPACGRTRSRGLAGRSRRVTCEPSPPVRPWSWSRSRFSARTGGSAAVRFAWVGIGLRPRLARMPEPPAGRVNDGVFINPVREGPRTAAGPGADGCIGGRCEARGIYRARRRVSGPGRRTD